MVGWAHGDTGFALGDGNDEGGRLASYEKLQGL